MRKILIIHHCDSWGGAGISLRNCCQMLQDNYEVTVLLPHKDSPVYEALVSNSRFRIITIEKDMGMITSYSGSHSVFSRSFFRDLWRIEQCKKDVEKVIAYGDYDFVLLNSITLSWVTRICHKCGIPNAVYIRETKKRSPVFMYSVHLINKYSSGACFISENDMTTINITLDKTAVVRDCVTDDELSLDDETDYYEKYGFNRGDFNLLYVGGLERIKGHKTLMVAMEYLLEYKDIKCYIAGRCNSKKAKDKSNVRYLGKIVKIQELYSICDVLLFPSTSPHQARPVFEAGFQHKPVIISDFKETAEAVTDKYNGLTVIPSDPKSLVEKILILYKDELLLKFLGTNNYNESIKKHSFKSCRIQLLSFLSKFDSLH